jgi:acyl-CoA reductase-like NAD-dependent aldehyde dehydrogenase
VIDPSTGAQIAEVPEASAEDIGVAAGAAAAAQPAWAGMPLAERVDALGRLRSLILIAGQRDDLALLESIDTGNPLP